MSRKVPLVLVGCVLVLFAAGCSDQQQIAGRWVATLPYSSGVETILLTITPDNHFSMMWLAEPGGKTVASTDGTLTRKGDYVFEMTPVDHEKKPASLLVAPDLKTLTMTGPDSLGGVYFGRDEAYINKLPKTKS